MPQDLMIGAQEQLPLALWRELVKHRAGWSCEECGDDYKEARKREDRKLHAHHIDENQSNNCLDNGAALCASCHGGVHGDAARFGGHVWQNTTESTKKSWETRWGYTRDEAEQAVAAWRASQKHEEVKN